MTGAPLAGVTVSVAPVLVAAPALPVTTMLKSAPLSAVIAAGIASVEEVAPMIFVPFLRHW